MSRRAAMAVGLLVATFAGYRWWNGDERQIRRQLAAVAAVVSHDSPALGVAALAEVAGLATYLAPDVTIDPGPPGAPLRGAQDVVSSAGRLRAAVPVFQLAFVDVQVAPAAGDTATVRATARISMQGRDGAGSTDARELEITMRWLDGRWVVAAARAVPTLQPVR